MPPGKRGMSQMMQRELVQKRRRSKSSNFKLEELKHLDAVGADVKPCRTSNGVLEEKS